MVSFGGRLREERTRLGLNQTEFAALAGVTKKTQGLYEAGDRAPDALYLAAIAEAGVDTTYVLTGDYLSVAQAKIAASNCSAGRDIAGQSNVATSQHLPPDEQLLLDAYRGLSPAKKKQLLAALLTGDVGKKPVKVGSGIVVTGSSNKTAGRDFHEKE